VFKIGIVVGVVLSAVPIPSFVNSTLVNKLNLDLSVVNSDYDQLQAQKLVTLKRCENLELKEALIPKVESITTAFGKVDLKYFENLIPGEGVVYLEALPDNSFFAAQSFRKGPLSTKFFKINFNSNPVKVDFVGQISDAAVLDLYLDTNKSELLYTSIVNDKRGFVWFQLSKIPILIGEPDMKGTKVLHSNYEKVGPFLVNGQLEGVPGSTGGRIAGYKDGSLLFTVGDFGLFPTKLPDQVMENFVNYDATTNTEYGSIYKLDRKTESTKMFSTGHRNPQGLVFDETNNVVWESEHGPLGGDEINQILEGSNYGWQNYTSGRPYEGFGLLEEKSFAKSYIEGPGVNGLNRWCASGAEQPYAILGSSSVAPSQLQILEPGNLKVPGNGRKLLLATLLDESLWIADVNGSKLSNWAKIPMGERIRDIAFGLNSKGIYLTFDSGRIMVIKKQM
jgi:hypothetical protein